MRICLNLQNDFSGGGGLRKESHSTCRVVRIAALPIAPGLSVVTKDHRCYRVIVAQPEKARSAAAEDDA